MLYYVSIKFIKGVGTDLNPKLREKTMESLSAVLPITAIVLLISIFLVPLELGSITLFTVGAIMLIFGMGFFQLGAEIAMTPIGEGLGVQEEKEIVMIIAKSEDKLPIMQSISDKCGMHSEAKGLVMSMPIDSLVGM